MTTIPKRKGKHQPSRLTKGFESGYERGPHTKTIRVVQLYCEKQRAGFRCANRTKNHDSTNVNDYTICCKLDVPRSENCLFRLFHRWLAISLSLARTFARHRCPGSLSLSLPQALVTRSERKGEDLLHPSSMLCCQSLALLCMLSN